MRYLKEYIPFAIIVATGTVFYHLVEGFRLLDAFYFSVITLTTTGFGDLSPKTDIGKLFTIFYILVGFGVMLNFLNHLYRKRVNKKEKIQQSIRKKKAKSDE